MNRRNLLVKTMLVALTLFLVACSAQSASQPVLTPTETVTPIHLTETPTLTPTPEPTSTPTITPTPMGGTGGLLLNQVVCPQNGECVQTIFLYNLVSHELVSFSDGYTALDASPDGKRILLKVNKWETGNLFILNLAQPGQITLFQENVDEAAWLGNSGWIGFISKVNGKRQVFLVHPDGSDLIQVTNSSIGAATLEPVFNDGVFWGEGTIDNGSRYIRNYKWTKLDGTETAYTNYNEVFPSGKSIMAMSMSPSGPCWGCKFDLIDVETSSNKEVILLPPDKNILSFVQPLSDDKWLAQSPATSNTNPQFWIYSSDGSVLAELPNAYGMVDDISPPSPYDLLSPDGTWTLVSKFEKISDNQFKVTYHLFNTKTSEIMDLPSLDYISTGMKIVGNRRIDGDIEGCRINKYFWVEIP